MKMLVAVVRPHKLQEDKGALSEIGISGMSVSDVRGCGRQKGRVERYRKSEYAIDLLAKIRLETVVEGDQVAAAVDCIARAARTGEIGDGKVFVLPIENAIRIRAGDHGADAL